MYDECSMQGGVNIIRFNHAPNKAVTRKSKCNAFSSVNKSSPFTAMIHGLIVDV